MKIAYFDCFCGAAGDMIVGACLDAGAPADKLRTELAKLGLKEVTISIEKVLKNGISATQFEPVIGEHHHHTHGHEHKHEHEHEHKHNHDHGHTHHEHTHGEHTHGHEHSGHAHEHTGHQPHRNLPTICDIIDAADLSQRVKQQAKAIFQRLAQAEAKIHNKGVDEIHFHEVGAADAIMDIVAACVALELLGIEKLYCSNLVVGSGTVRCAHGVLPVPAPATAEMLKGLEVSSGPVGGELLTPTGAAILTELSEGFGAMPPMSVTATGYGAGQRTNKDVPNVLRLMVGEQKQDAQADDEVCVLEANIDDATGELLGYVSELLLSGGALDVFSTAVMMKKGRPGVQLTVLCRSVDRQRLSRLLLTESTTFGLRWHNCKRSILQRERRQVETPFGPIGIKCGMIAGELITASPEFDDCKKAAMDHGVPIKKVMDQARMAFNQG